MIFINFTQPLLVSKGTYRDSVSLKFKNLALFVSKESAVSLQTENSEISKTIPRQLPKNVDVVALVDSANNIQTALACLVWIQLGLQFAFKNSIADMLGGFYCIQLCTFFTLYQVSFQANSDIYISEFRKLVTFHAIKPDNIIGLFFPGFKINQIFGIAKEQLKANQENSGLESTSFLANMSTYIFIGAIVVVVLILLKILTMFKSVFQDKLKSELQTTIKGFLFNKQIKGMKMAYLKTVISVTMLISL